MAVLYFEVVNPHDSFGEQMILNMREREVYLPTFAEIGFAENYARQLSTGGLTPCVQIAWKTYNAWPGRKDIEQLEWLDEFEQFQLIMEHYAVIFGYKGVAAELNIFAAVQQQE